jgi:probable O-glycosylation ligase (exosortase A-associated)
VPIRGLIWVAYFLASLPFCFLRPFYGILLWTVIAFMNPQWYTWSAGEWLPWAQLAAIPTLLGAAVFVRNWGRIASRETFLILMLWIWFTITSFASSHNPVFIHHSADTWYQWQFVSKIIVMALIAIPVVHDFARLRILVITIACCFGFLILKSFPFIILTGGQFRLYGPSYSMIADNNDLGLALNMTLPLFFFLAQTETGWLKRLFGVLFVIDIPCIFFTYSRGALVGLIILLFLLFLRIKQRLLLIPVIVIGVAVAFLFAPPAWRHRMDPTRPDAVDGSAQARLVAWRYAWELASDHPVTGGGFQTFTRQLFANYGVQSLYVHGPHSIYFEVLAEHGFVGLALYLILVGSCFLTGRDVLVMARSLQDPMLANYAHMLRFSLIGFLVSGIFLGRAYFDYYFSIVVCLVILKKIATEEWINSEDSEEELLLTGELADINGAVV